MGNILSKKDGPICQKCRRAYFLARAEYSTKQPDGHFTVNYDGLSKDIKTGRCRGHKADEIKDMFEMFDRLHAGAVRQYCMQRRDWFNRLMNGDPATVPEHPYLSLEEHEQFLKAVKWPEYLITRRDWHVAQGTGSSSPPAARDPVSFFAGL